MDRPDEHREDAYRSVLLASPRILSVEDNSAKTRCFYCGIISGGFQAGIFNPYDRAIFLSHVHKRPFLDLRNFHRPYEGFHQSVFHRIISGGMYFPLEDSLRAVCPVKSPIVSSALSGMVAGSIIALCTNPLSAIKYQSWGSAHGGKMILTAKDMFLRGGCQAFARGITLTLARDLVWGGTYATLRHWLPLLAYGRDGKNAARTVLTEPSIPSFFANMVAGGCGTVLAAPLNYARNLRYGRNIEHTASSTVDIFRELRKDVYESRGRNRFIFLVNRLAIGWGTMRVALGMAFSSQLYLFCLSP